MNKRLINLANWSSNQLARASRAIQKWARPAEQPPQFVDLAPTESADQGGVYARALKYATDNPRVSNIALTGPYGSGKSSIILSFLKTYERSALHISLAAFLPDAEDKRRSITKQEVERSILQQLLYGADANKLPLSRFKRIQSPGSLTVLRSLYASFGIAALLYVFNQRDAIFAGTYFSPFDLSNWAKILVFACTGLFVWSVIYHFYVISFGISLKSVSLKNIELGLSGVDQDSILNRHLDEIVYFFQRTKYDLVVVEDLDRFEDSDIFVTLREINSLINRNVDIRRPVRFLYALRDDMFANTDRTKFFEFIIPVIPIINSSNSVDMVLEQGKRLSLVEKLNKQFLREVSRYLNDLRLIHNVFNEYAIYVANLETDGENNLDANKLLAVLIYKNVYPRDFERLHRGEGRLASIFARKDALVAKQEKTYKAEIVQIDQAVEASEQQLPRTLFELRRIYAMALVEKLPTHTSYVSLDQSNWIALQQLPDFDGFEQLITTPTVFYRSIHGHTGRSDLAGLQSEIDPSATYDERARLIEGKSDAFKKSARDRTAELRGLIKGVRTSKFNTLLRNNSDELRGIFEELGDSGDLARFLLLEGYLDDSYYQYTSLFHSGRLSPNDNKFLIQIRAFKTPDPDFPIDNPMEVIEGMRDDDFGVSYVLNVKLVDALFGQGGRGDRVERLLRLLSNEFREHQDFFVAYYASGSRVSDLLLALHLDWPGFVPAVLASQMSTTHVAKLIEHLPSESLKEMVRVDPAFREFISEELAGILAIAADLDPSKLAPLEIEVRDLSAIEDHGSVARELIDRGRYRINIVNLQYIFEKVLGEDVNNGFRKRNLTTILDAGNEALESRIGDDFETYFNVVLMDLAENVEEDIPAIIYTMSREDLELESVKAFVARQARSLPTLEQVPERYQAELFRIAKIEPSWKNCVAFLEGETFDPESFLAFLNNDPIRASLLTVPIPADDTAQMLRTFLFNADGLDDVAYRAYIQALPKKFETFPKEIGSSKLRILVDEGRVTFNRTNLTALVDDSDLQLLFVKKNIDAYLAETDSFGLDDDFRERLLGTDLTDDKKVAVIHQMDMNLLPGLPERAAAIGPIVARTNDKLPSLSSDAIRSIVLNSKPVTTQISLLNKLQSDLSVADVRQIIPLLPKPYGEITIGWARPRLSPTEINKELVRWLARRKVISSFGSAVWSDDIVVYLFHK